MTYGKIGSTVCKPKCNVEDCDLCENLNPNNCKICAKLFDLIEGTCRPSCSVSKCDDCVRLKPSECKTCTVDYHLNEKRTCDWDCIDNCTECSAPKICATCAKGFILLNNVCVICKVDKCV